MKPSELEQRLERLGRDWPADTSLVERVMHTIDVQGVQPETPRTRSRLRSWLTLAAAVALLAAAWWIIAPVDNSLYAQAREALASARTIHRTFRVIQLDGKSQVGVESWCERGQGFRVNLPHEVRLGNAQNFWTYREKDKLALRSRSVNLDALIDRELDLERVLLELKSQGFERFPAADEQTDGRRLSAYLLPPPKGAAGSVAAEQTRGIVLLDEKSRVVRTRREARRGDAWVATFEIDFEYDQPIDRALFEAKFPGDVRIVDGDHPFDQLTDLDKALYQDERKGIIFAIHRLERFDDHGLFVLSSVRAAPETLKKYPLQSRTVQLGLSVTEGPARNLMISPQGNQHLRIDMASVMYNGVDLCWWVLVPRDTNAPPYEAAPDKVNLPLGFTPVGWTAYGKTLVDEKNVLQHTTWDALIDLPAAANPPALADIAGSIFSDLTLLGGIPFRQVYCGVKPGTNESDRRNPDDVTADQYRSCAERNVRLWYERDLAFQLSGQFDPEMLRQAQAQASAAGARRSSPAIGLNYNPLVDDFTLAEIAKRTTIERLYLDGTRITDQGLRELAPLKNLHELSLNNVPVTDAGLKHLAALTSLKKLYLHHTGATIAGVAELKQAIPVLKVSE